MPCVCREPIPYLSADCCTGLPNSYSEGSAPMSLEAEPSFLYARGIYSIRATACSKIWPPTSAGPRGAEMLMAMSSSSSGM